MNEVRLRATKTFFMNGRFIAMGDEFTLNEFQANAYITRNLAERIEETKAGEPEETKEITPDFTPETEQEREPQVLEPTEPEQTEDPLTYAEMTVTKLKELAKERGIEGYSKLTKAELVQAHFDYDNNQTVLDNEEE